MFHVNFQRWTCPVKNDWTWCPNMSVPLTKIGSLHFGVPNDPGGGRIYSHVLLRPPGYEMTWKALKSHEMTWIHSNEFAALLNFKSNLTIYIYIYINLYIYNISIIHITPFEFLLSGLFWSNFRMLKIAIQAWWFWCHIIHVTSCNKNQRPCESSSPFPKFLHRWGHFKSQEDYQNVTRWYLFARVFPRCYLQKHP